MEQDGPTYYLSVEDRWANPRFPLIEGPYGGRLDEFLLSIVRRLGYMGSDKSLDVIRFFITLSEESKSLIFDVLVVCTEHGPLSELELDRLKIDIMEIENARS